LTQRPLTAAERTKIASAYRELGSIRSMFGDEQMTVNDLCVELSERIWHNTTDGKPLRTERVPTNEDIGKRVKVRPSGVSSRWMTGFVLVCFRDDFFVVHDPSGGYFSFSNCIIDEEAT